MIDKILFSIIALIGVVLSFLGMPGSYVILAVFAFYGIYANFTSDQWWVLIAFAVITIITSLLDNVASLLGAKKYGASRYGMIGAFLGGVIGAFLWFPIGMIIGPFIGAIILEFIKNPELKKALNAGKGSVIGLLLGLLVKVVITIVLYIWFLFILW